MKENEKTTILNQKSEINNNIIDDDTTFKQYITIIKISIKN